MLREGPVVQKFLSRMDQGAQAPRWMPGGLGSWTHSDILLWLSPDKKPKILIESSWSGLLQSWQINSALCGFHPSFSSLSRACRNSWLSILALETQRRAFETFWLQHMWKFAKLVSNISPSGFVLQTGLIHAREETKCDLLLVQLQPLSCIF